MKNLIKYLLVLTILLCFQTCDEKDLDRTFLIPPTENFVFQNNFQSEYVLDFNSINDTAETLSWNMLSFGSDDVLVNYRVQGSISEDFSTIDFETGNTRELQYVLSIANLYSLGETAGLDNDPETTDGNGNPNNTGTIYLRVVSFVGNFDATNNVNVYSIPQAVNIEMVELQCEGSELSTWGFVGPFNGWTVNSTPVYALHTTNSPDIFSGVVTVDDDGFKITVLDGSWSTSYAYGGSDGTLALDAGFDPVIPTTAGHYLFTADLANLTYSLEPTTAYGIIGPATPNGWDGPNHKFVPDDCEPGVYVARNIPMVAGEFFIRANDDWTESYALGTSDGTFQVNPGIGATGMPVTADGNYDIIVNFNDFTYELIAL